MSDTDLFLQLDKRIDRSPSLPKKQRSPGERTTSRQLPSQQPATPPSSTAKNPPGLSGTVGKSKTTARPLPPHVSHDVMTSLLHGVNLRNWRDVIENTETQNSALRLTSEERYAVEDVINELRRKEKIKTSMNEIARLGLLLLIHDFKKNKHNAIVYKVKKS